MGFDAAHAASTLRFSFSRLNTQTETEAAAAAVIEAVHKMRSERGGNSVVIINKEYPHEPPLNL